MRKSILRASAALQAVALLGAGATAFVAAAPAAAQDYTSGILAGTVRTASGAPVAGAAVTIRSLQLGTVSNGTTGADGSFSFSSLPVGDYDVTVTAPGNRTFTATAVQIQPGRTSEVPVVLTAGTADAGGAIVVSGRRIQAFSGTTTGKNIDVAEIVKTVPLGRTLTDVTLLAPGTVKGDSSFGNLASIGGSSVAENAYYVNGLNTTNFDNYLGSAPVPFEFYKTVEVKSGGYPAEFGRATGGIVNAVTKAGTNDVLAAIHVNWEPDFLRGTGKDLLNCSEGAGGTVSCDPYTQRKGDRTDRVSVIGELGMPIIRDRLFVYGLVEMHNNVSQTISTLNHNVTEDRNTSPFWAAKVDAIPVDGQHLEFTIFDTRNTTTRYVRDWADDGTDRGQIGAITSTRAFNGGGVNYVAKYTGRFTDFFTLSGAYGRMRDRFDSPGLDEASNAAYIANASKTTLFGVPNGGLYTAQTASSTDFPYTTERKFYRADADVYVKNFIGNHHFRFGFDKEDDTLNHSAVRTGHNALCTSGFLTTAACTVNGGAGGASLIFRPTDATGLPIVEVNYYNSGGSFTSTNTAYYLEDEWKTPLTGLTLNLGVRRDDFDVKNPVGDPFITLDNNWAPRVGFTFDAFPAVRGQIFGSYGWYYLPIASNTAFRATSAEYYLRERYYVDPTNPFDANGLPNITAPVVNNADYQDACTIKLVDMSTGVNCNQTSDGSPKDPTYYIAKNLKPTRESEIILGYRQRIKDFDVALSFTHRQTDNLNEDSSFSEGIINYCHDHGIAGCDSYYTTGSEQFVIANVGKDVTFIAGPGGPLAGQVITVTAAEAGYPKAKRTYDAFDLTWNRAFDGVWAFGGSYTLSWSKGNSEGFVNSDTGQDDAGVLADWDFPGFMDYAYGYLPNDRRHKLKVYGAYAPIPNLILGANLQVTSPRHLSCFGWNPNNYFANNYAAAYNHYCNGQPSPRGTAQHTDWTTQLDLSGRYNIVVPATGLTVTLRADVFNVFNSQAIQYRNEVGDLDAGGYNSAGLPTTFTPNPNFGQPRVYQTPRSIRLGVDVAFGPAAVPPPPPVEIAPPPPPPATQTCPDGSVIAVDATCPVPPPPPPPPPAPVERGERGQ